MRLVVVSVFVAGVGLGGCASTGIMHTGTLAAQNGKVLPFEIEHASRSGAVRATDPETGEHFSGQYTGILETVSGRSNTFAMAGNATAYGSRRSSASSNIADANAFLSGDKGTTLTCTMKIEAGLSPHGIGQCQDNKGMSYQLQF